MVFCRELTTTNKIQYYCCMSCKLFLSKFPPVTRNQLFQIKRRKLTNKCFYSSLERSLSKRRKKTVSFRAKMAGIIVVFDFDRTLIDSDSDRWVVHGLGVSQLFNELYSTIPWNPLMDRMMTELHSQGKTIKEIAEHLQQMTLHPKIMSAIKSAHALGCDLRILSDANMFFIETILEHHDLKSYFSEIIANPSIVDEEGRLRISPYHDSSSIPHGCPRCPPNLCKGLVMERMKTTAGKKQFIYLGDGSGDYCPSLKLEQGDHLMPRKNYPLWKLVSSNPSLVKAEIHEWNDGDELERILLNLINTAISRCPDSAS